MTFLKTLTLVLAVSMTCALPCPPKKAPSFAAMFEEAEGTVVEYCELTFEILNNFASHVYEYSSLGDMYLVTTFNTPQLKWVRCLEDLDSLELSVEQVAALPYTKNPKWFTKSLFSIDREGTCYQAKEIIDEASIPGKLLTEIIDEPMHQPGSEEALACWAEHLARLLRK